MVHCLRSYTLNVQLLLGKDQGWQDSQVVVDLCNGLGGSEQVAKLNSCLDISGEDICKKHCWLNAFPSAWMLANNSKQTPHSLWSPLYVLPQVLLMTVVDKHLKYNFSSVQVLLNFSARHSPRGNVLTLSQRGDSGKLEKTFLTRLGSGGQIIISSGLPIGLCGVFDLELWNWQV